MARSAQYQKVISICLGVMAGILLYVAPVAAQTYTIAPSPFLTALDDSGNIIVNGCIWTYAAGTSTPIATYSSNAGALNSNPIIADYAGRFTVYLLAGTNYKFAYESACSPPSHGTTMRTADNIAGSPGSAATVDVQGTAGETISGGQCAYLSAGDGGKNAGQYYKCDSSNGYSSSTAGIIGIAPSPITIGATGSIRIMGLVSGLSSLTPTAGYFVGTSGAITNTSPNGGRYLGEADSSTTFVVGTPRPVAQAWVDDFRLTLTTALPVTTADVTAATTIFCTPMNGNRIDLPDASGNPVRVTSAEFSIAVPATTTQMYDIYAYNNAGVAALELLAWTNDTTRATAIIRTTTGRYYKTGDLTRMYVGSFRTTGVSGQTEDSVTKRYLWNYYNRARRLGQRLETTASWTYTTAALRQANGAAANQLDFVVGVAEVALTVNLAVSFSNSTGGVNVTVGIAEDGVTPVLSGAIGGQGNGAAGIAAQLFVMVTKYPAVGRHFYPWVEFSAATGTTTWYGNITGQNASGLSGWMEG